MHYLLLKLWPPWRHYLLLKLWPPQMHYYLLKLWPLWCITSSSSYDPLGGITSSSSSDPLRCITISLSSDPSDASPPPQAMTPLMRYLLLVDVDSEGDGAAIIHVVLAGQLGATRHGSRLPRYFLQHVTHRHFSVLLGEANNMQL